MGDYMEVYLVMGKVLLNFFPAVLMILILLIYELNIEYKNR